MAKSTNRFYKTHQKLIRAALIVFSKKGYFSTFLKDIAKESGIHPETIYYHFDSKLDLYKSMMNEGINMTIKTLDRVLNSRLSPLEKIKQFFINIFIMIENVNEYRSFIELVIIKDEFNFKLNPATQEISSLKQYMQESLILQITNSQSIGQIHPKINPQLYSFGLIVYSRFVIMYWFNHQQSISLGADAENYINYFIEGILKI